MARRPSSQGAIAALAAMRGDAPRRRSSGWLDQLIAGKSPPRSSST